MFNSGTLFKERLTAHIKLLNRYLRYIFNGHFMIALMFIIVTLAVYYQRWLADVSSSFPAAIVIAIAFSFIVLYNPIQSFLKEPDKVFITVKEKEMDRYFFYALVYNYVVQLYIVFFVIAGIGPMYFTFYSDRTWVLNIMIVGIILLMKGWHLLINWHVLQIDNQTFVLIERFVRITFTFVLFYSLITFQYLPFIGLAYVIYINVLYLYIKKGRHLHWEQLIQNDANRLATFYRFVSLFAQVPHIKSKMRKRRFLTMIVRRQTPYKKDATFLYLYRLTFLRSGEYFSLFIRLTIIALLAIVFVANVWVKLALAVLFMYMTSFQLQTLFHHYRTNVWLDLYPLDPSTKQTAFLTLAMQLSQVQAIVLSIGFVAINEWLFFIIMLFAGTIFNIAFHQLYVKRKIQTVA